MSKDLGIESLKKAAGHSWRHWFIEVDTVAKFFILRFGAISWDTGRDATFFGRNASRSVQLVSLFAHSTRWVSGESVNSAK